MEIITPDGGNGAIIGGNNNGNTGNTRNNSGNGNTSENIVLENDDLNNDMVNTDSDDLANSIYDEFLGNIELIGNMELGELEELITEINTTINRVARFDSNNQEIAATSSKIIDDIANSLEKNTINHAFGFSKDTVGFSLLVALLIVLIILVSICTVKKQISDKEKYVDKTENETEK